MSRISPSVYSNAEKALLVCGDQRGGLDRSEKTVVIIMGLPGSGKSSLARMVSLEPLLPDSAVYLEETLRNPFFPSPKNKQFNPKKSQNWFLSNYAKALDEFGVKRHLILDQDPRAVVLVYSRFFRNNGVILDEDYNLDVDTCLRIWDRIVNTYDRIVYVLLSTRSSILLDRIRDRGGDFIFDRKSLKEIETLYEKYIRYLNEQNNEYWLEYDSGQLTTREIHSALKAELQRVCVHSK